MVGFYAGRALLYDAATAKSKAGNASLGLFMHFKP